MPTRPEHELSASEVEFLETGRHVDNEYRLVPKPATLSSLSSFTAGLLHQDLFHGGVDPQEVESAVGHWSFRFDSLLALDDAQLQL